MKKKLLILCIICCIIPSISLGNEGSNSEATQIQELEQKIQKLKEQQKIQKLQKEIQELEQSTENPSKQKNQKQTTTSLAKTKSIPKKIKTATTQSKNKVIFSTGYSATSSTLTGAYIAGSDEQTSGENMKNPRGLSIGIESKISKNKPLYLISSFSINQTQGTSAGEYEMSGTMLQGEQSIKFKVKTFDLGILYKIKDKKNSFVDIGAGIQNSKINLDVESTMSFTYYGYDYNDTDLEKISTNVLSPYLLLGYGQTFTKYPKWSAKITAKLFSAKKKFESKQYTEEIALSSSANFSIGYAF